MSLSVDYIYLTSCRGFCRDSYKNKVKNLGNMKVVIDDLQKKFVKDICLCTTGYDMFTEKCEDYILNCNCEEEEYFDEYCDEYESYDKITEKNDVNCHGFCVKSYNIYHDHSGPCENVAKCECKKNHYTYPSKLYCNGTNLFRFAHDYTTHKYIYSFNCGKECNKFHYGNNADDVIMKHNNIKPEEINNLLTQECGEVCRFSRVNHEYLIEQVAQDQPIL